MVKEHFIIMKLINMKEKNMKENGKMTKLKEKGK